jgi:hypothetical protein
MSRTLLAAILVVVLLLIATCVVCGCLGLQVQRAGGPFS